MESPFAEEAYPIEKWEVYRVFTRHTNPAKEKLVIIVISGAETYGFFFDSKVTPFVEARPGLLQCIVDIGASDHPFLRYDSKVDCRRTYYFTEPELWGNYVGRLSDSAIEAIEGAVKRCTVLSGYDKIRILEE